MHELLAPLFWVYLLIHLYYPTRIMVLRVNWNVLCYNVRGLNSDAKHLAVSNAINSSGCAVSCLQETKNPLLIMLLLNPAALGVLINLISSLPVGLREVLSRFGIVQFSLQVLLLKKILPWLHDFNQPNRHIFGHWSMFMALAQGMIRMRSPTGSMMFKFLMDKIGY